MNLDSVEIFDQIEDICGVALNDFQGYRQPFSSKNIQKRIDEIADFVGIDIDDIKSAKDIVSSSLAIIADTYEYNDIYFTSKKALPDVIENLASGVCALLSLTIAESNRYNSEKSGLISEMKIKDEKIVSLDENIMQLLEQEKANTLNEASLLQSLKEKDEALAGLVADSNGFKRIIDGLNCNIQESSSEVSSLNDHIAALQSELAESTETIIHLRSSLTDASNDAQTKANQYQIELDGKKSEIQSLKDEISHLKNSLQSKVESIAELESNVYTLRRDVEEAKSLMASTMGGQEAELFEAKHSVVALEGQVKQLESHLASVVSEKTLLIDELQNRERELNDLNECKKVNEEQTLVIARLKGLLDESNASLSRAIIERNQSHDAAQRAQRDADAASMELTSLKLSLQSDLSAYEEQINAYESDLSDLKQRLAEQTNLAAAWQDRMAVLSSDIEVERRTFARELADARSDLARAQASESSYKADLETARRSIEAAQSVQQDLEKVRNHRDALLKSNGELENLVHLRELKIQELNEAITCYMELTATNMGVGHAEGNAPLSPTSTAQGNLVQKDRIFVLPSALSVGLSDIIFIEIGSFESTIAGWNSVDKCFEVLLRCPSIVATARRAVREQVLVGASFMSDPMYQSFRETGILVGGNADHCLNFHPDGSLRGILKAEPIVARGNLLKLEHFARLVEHLFLKGAKAQDASELQVLCSYKLSFNASSLSILAETLFEKVCADKVCFISEASLVASSAFLSGPSSKSLSSLNSTTALIVNIGAYETTVYPCYEGIVMRQYVVSTPLGGEHCTDFLEALLCANKSARDASFKSQSENRRRCIARSVKEKCGFVVQSFAKAESHYGRVVFEYRKAMADEVINSVSSNSGSSGSGSGSSVALDVVKSTETEHTPSLRFAMDVSLADGHRQTIEVDRERFYCTEVLFNPNLMFADEAAKDSNNSADPTDSGGSTQRLNIVDAIISSIQAIDELVRTEVCATIILSGKSALFPGLLDRVQLELIDRVVGLGVDSFEVVVREDKAASAVLRGATARMQHAAEVPFEAQNFVTSSDYATDGSSLLSNVLVG